MSSLVRLLGPIDVLAEDGVVHRPASALRRSILAVLAINAGRPVSLSRLLDTVWGSNQPASGPSALRFHVSKLRSELPVPQLIVTRPSSYVLNGITDVMQVERTVFGPSAGLDDLAAALDLWRGDPLLDAQPSHGIESEQTRLAELELQLQERLFERRLDSAGGASDHLGDLDRLCHAHPLRERLWALLIRAKFQSGNQADALRTITQLRVTLRDELGVSPSDQLQRLEQRILAQDASLAAATAHNASAARVRESQPTTNLLESSTPLSGRATALASLQKLIDTRPLITVVGIGGIGKTSIARAVATQANELFDEIWFIELASANSQNVNAVAARAMGIADVSHGGWGIAETLRRRGRCLVVLDNCEHVLEATRQLCNALTDVAHVSVLATSRLALEMPNETVYRLGPLESSEAAIGLFLHHARRHAPDLSPNEYDRKIVEAICAQVSDIPLAIELAAARARSLGPGAILQHLSSLLGRSQRSSLESARGESMTAAIDWTLDLLSNELIGGLVACTAFAGTFDLAALEHVVGADPDVDPIAIIDDLVGCSLLQVRETPVGLRYQMLEPVRRRTIEVVQADRTSARDAHLDHYLSRLEDAYAAFATNSCDPLLNMARYDLDNLRNVHHWALERDRFDDDLRLYWPLAIAAYHDIYEPGEWAAETLKRCSFGGGPKWQRAAAGAKILLGARGEADAAEAIRAQLEECFDDGSRAPSTIAVLAGSLTVRGAHEEAIDMWSLVEHAEDPLTRFYYYWHVWISLLGAASVESTTTRSMEAKLEIGIEWARSVGARNIEAALHEVYAAKQLLLGNFSECNSLAQSALDLATETQMGFVRNRAREHLARSAILETGSLSTAAVHLLDLLRDAVAAGSAQSAGMALGTCSLLFAKAGRLDSAAVAYAAAVNPTHDPSLEAVRSVLTNELLDYARDRLDRERLSSLDVSVLVAAELAELSN